MPGARRRAARLAALWALALAASCGGDAPLDAAGGAASASGELRVLGAVSHPTHGAPVGVVYLRIENDGSQADRLVAVESSAAGSAQVHETVFQGDAVRMVRRAEVEIPPGARIVFEPGGLHIMLTGLDEPLRAGQAIPLRLDFERAGTLRLSVPVLANDASG